MMVFLIACVLGGFGAVLRYGVDTGVGVVVAKGVRAWSDRRESRESRQSHGFEHGECATDNHSDSRTENKKSSVVIPLGIMVVNVTACLLVGMLTGWVLAHGGGGHGGESWNLFGFTSSPISVSTIKYLLGSGFLGGYSTFSTASVEGMRLIGQRRYVAVLIHTGGMLVLSIAFCFLGMWAGQFIR